MRARVAHVLKLSSLMSGAVATRPALCMLVAQLPPAAVLMRTRLHAVGHATRACPTSLGQVGVEPWSGSRSPATDIAVSYDLVVQRSPWVSAPILPSGLDAVWPMSWLQSGPRSQTQSSILGSSVWTILLATAVL